MPKISIITISYNSEKYIEQCILSVINQSYQNKEYIIIDGGSTDSTLEIITKYKDQIDYFKSEPDKGISDAFNKGIQYATGDIIGLINSDDQLTTDSLNILANHYDPKTEVYRGKTILWDDKTNSCFIEQPSMKFAKIPVNFHVCHPSTFISKQAYQTRGLYRNELRYAMDFDLLVRYSWNHAVFKYVDFDLALFRLGGHSQKSEKERTAELTTILKLNGCTTLQTRIFASLYELRLILKRLVSIFGKNIRLYFIGKRKKRNICYY